MGNLYRHKFIIFLKAEEMKEFPSGHLMTEKDSADYPRS